MYCFIHIVIRLIGTVDPLGDYESRKDVDRFEEGRAYMYIISNLFIQLSLMCFSF